MTASPLVITQARFFTAGGLPLAGGKVYTYAAGTSTPKASYTDAGGLTANTNPVILDSTGSASIFLNGSYKIAVTDSAGVNQPQYAADNQSDILTLISNNPTVFSGGINFSGPVTFNNKTITSAYTIVSNDAGTTILAGGTNLYNITFPSASTMSSTNHATTITNTDTGRAKNIVVPGFSNFFLWPSQSITVTRVGTAWSVTPLNRRWEINSNLTIYVDPAGNDNNDGLATLATNTNGPLLTIAKATQIIQSYIDSANHLITVQCADGTYSAGFSVAGPMVGAVQFYVTGNIANPQNCIISLPVAGVCFETADEAIVTVQGFTLTGPNNSVGIHAWKNAGLDYGSIIFGEVGNTGTHISADLGGLVICVGNCTITGNCYYHYSAQSNGYVKPTGFTVTIPAPMGASGSFAFAASCGLIQGPPTFTGAGVSGCGGVRANAIDNGIVYIGGNANAFPGSSPNTSSTGGIVR